MRAPRSLRRLGVARAQVRRMAEVERVVCAELERHEGGDTVLDLDSGAELAWQDHQPMGFVVEPR